MSTSAIHEFAKTSSAEDVFDIYKRGLLLKVAEGEASAAEAKPSKAQRVLAKLRSSGESAATKARAAVEQTPETVQEVRAKVQRGTTRAREAVSNALPKKEHGVGHKLRHNKGKAGVGALAIGGGGAYLAHRHFNQEKDASAQAVFSVYDAALMEKEAGSTKRLARIEKSREKVLRRGHWRPELDEPRRRAYNRMTDRVDKAIAGGIETRDPKKVKRVLEHWGAATRGSASFSEDVARNGRGMAEAWSARQSKGSKLLNKVRRILHK